MDVSGPRDVFPAVAQTMPISEVRELVEKACLDGSWSHKCSENRTLGFYIASRKEESEAVELWDLLISKLKAMAAQNQPTTATMTTTTTTTSSVPPTVEKTTTTTATSTTTTTIDDAAEDGELVGPTTTTTTTTVTTPLTTPTTTTPPAATTGGPSSVYSGCGMALGFSYPIDIVDVYGQTPIFYGAREGHCNLLRIMVNSYKFDPRVLDGTKQSALYYACREGHDDVIRFLVSECHVPIDQVDVNGDTALFYAARDNRESACKLMIEELGADCCFKNKYKKYASGIARLMGHRKLATYLEQARRTHHGGGAPPGGGGESISTKASDNEDMKPDNASPSTVASASVAKPKRSLRTKRRGDALVLSEDEKISRSSPKRRAKKSTSPIMAAQKPLEETRDLCCLQYMSPQKSWSHPPQFKIEEFKDLFPQVAVWNCKAAAAAAQTLEADPYRTEWHRLATDVMRHLCNEVEDAHFFRDPVDTTKWNIPDYYDIVKEPIDFGTILTNLEVGVEYVTIKEFMRDLNRVFDNCILYNGPESSIGKIAQKVREAALTYAESIGLEELAEQESSFARVAEHAAAAAQTDGSAAAPPAPPPAAAIATT